MQAGQLTDQPGTGQVTAGPAAHFVAIPRDDVAAFVAAALLQPALRHVTIEVAGGLTPIPDAVARLVPPS